MSRPMKFGTSKKRTLAGCHIRVLVKRKTLGECSTDAQNLSLIILRPYLRAIDLDLLHHLVDLGLLRGGSITLLCSMPVELGFSWR